MTRSLSVGFEEEAMEYIRVTKENLENGPAGMYTGSVC